MAHQQMYILATLFVLLLMLGQLTSQQCGTEQYYSVYQAMLKGHTFQRLKVRPNSFECRLACIADVRCQSYNYVINEHICELNNRTKEARPEDFVTDNDRYYMNKGPKRVSLGSIPELPGDTCTEIKASEGGQVASGHYWLDTTKSGIPILAECDMKTEIADHCIRHHCLNNATCVNRQVNYTCACKPGWTGNYCGQGCPEDWVPFNVSCYNITSTRSNNVTDARKQCADVGADLPIIYSKEENNFIFNMLKDKLGGNGWLWLGLLRNPNATSKFYWFDGTPIEGNYDAWASKEPSNKNHICVFMGNNGHWNDFPCENQKGPSVLCQRAM